MSNKSKLDKDRLYFTQNFHTIRLRRPECVRTKKLLRHCKVYKNLAALWVHIKQEHGAISNLDFNSKELVVVLNAVDKAIKWSILAP